VEVVNIISVYIVRLLYISLVRFFPIYSQNKGILPGKNPFLPMGREEIPFFQEETQPWYV